MPYKDPIQRQACRDRYAAKVKGDPLLLASHRRRQREGARARMSAWTPVRRQEARAYCKAYYATHRDALLVAARQYREGRRLERTTYNKAYIKSHRDRYNFLRNKYLARRRVSCPQFKLIQSLRRRVAGALRGAIKIATTVSLLGCSPEQLRQHLERKFHPGMSWLNYGIMGWHVDHIKPCASFDLSIPEHQRQCFHYTNLQPLWWYDNLQKGTYTHA